eukprot:CAMPEP_0195046000 /NCGR_PEP_ID=MMETSP0347-20130606/20370_1 /TAXON_ID=2932 /ORGANISM="Alexandrium fundyense, Strain CCMP1719" /LENGTH=44 /DNA_ID= /DNA_START= /DNA_END= /DNA_ORIENTATION=
MEGLKYYATVECQENQRVEFGNIDIGGGFRRVFVDEEGSGRKDI